MKLGLPAAAILALTVIASPAEAVDNLVIDATITDGGTFKHKDVSLVGQSLTLKLSFDRSPFDRNVIVESFSLSDPKDSGSFYDTTFEQSASNLNINGFFADAGHFFDSFQNISLNLAGSGIISRDGDFESFDASRVDLSSSSLSASNVENLSLPGDDPSSFGYSIDAKITGLSASTSSAVPEPAAWAMMIAGFGMAGGIMRRNRYTCIRVAYA